MQHPVAAVEDQELRDIMKSEILKLPEREKLDFMVGRRLGWYRNLDDLQVAVRRDKVDQALWHFQSEGHEDFVTEAFAAVLFADQNLTKHFLNSILDVNVDQTERVVVETQSEYDSGKAGMSRPDMELRSKSFILFIFRRRPLKAVRLTLTRRPLILPGKLMCPNLMEQFDKLMHKLMLCPIFRRT